METAHALYFSFDRGVMVLFKTWSAKKLEVFLPVVIALGLISAYLTAKPFLKSSWRRQEQNQTRSNQPTTTPNDVPLSSEVNVLSPNTRSASISRRDTRIFSKENLVAAFVYLLNSSLKLILMLIVMTYCAWFLVAVLAGAGFSYYMFDGNDRGSQIRPGNELKENACSSTNMAFQQGGTVVTESITQL